ncbi:MAG: hypothetical protein RIS19_675 [Actinomycetota bacterium]
MDKCSRCGDPRVGQERFCTNCGADVSGNKKSLVGKWLSGMGCLFALSPIAIAMLATPIGGNLFSTGGDGGGAALYFLMITLPLGAIASILGIVLWATNKRK